MHLFRNLLHDYLFTIPVVVLVLTEITKMLVENFRSGAWHLALFRPGGFPSSHSAFVTSLLIIVWHKLGLQSVEFAMAFVFAGIVWYDAMSVRRAVGEQAKALNQLQTLLHFAERLGHSFVEVIGGIAFGAVVTAIGIVMS
ncbi:divergent PAP2 family protein [Candidatus Peribacteria bacterium]|nr:divergent PAP2 family protein [Candidatus Peribacteria bacterium]